jgi:hypothetical protein
MLEMSNYYLTEMAPASAQVYGFLREFGDKMYGLFGTVWLPIRNGITSMPAQFNILL